jgi:mono/diheme cytochrome c family protein
MSVAVTLFPCAGKEKDQMRPWRLAILGPILAGGFAVYSGAAAQQDAGAGKAPGPADERTYNGFKRYHAGCNHCHGQDGMGSTFGPALVDGLPDIETFRRIVRNGTSNGASVMKGFAGDPNVAPYEDDIYAYLQARAEGRLGRGRPLQAKP